MFEKIDTEINVTEKAIKEIKKLIEENEITEEFGLRIGVKGGGCSGLTYKLGFDSTINESDTVIEKDAIKFIIDGKSLFYLSGFELDFSSGLDGRGFIFNNPNAVKTCGCGESFGI